MAWAHRTVKQELEVVGLSSRYPILEIARRTGLSPAQVFAIRRKYHVVARFGRQHAAANRYAYDEHQWGRVLEDLYHEQGLTMAQVAERTGLHVSTVRRRMSAIGLRIKPVGEIRRGRKHSKRHDHGLPECAHEGCTTGVRTPGEVLCARCRRWTQQRASGRGSSG